MLLQVFPTSAYQALYDGLRNTTAAGGPTYHVANYTVVTNNHQAVFGGWQVISTWAHCTPPGSTYRKDRPVVLAMATKDARQLVVLRDICLGRSSPTSGCQTGWLFSEGARSAHDHDAVCTPTQVEVLWVVNQRQANWEAALPRETSQLLQSARGESTGTIGDIASQAVGAVNEQLGTGALRLVASRALRFCLDARILVVTAYVRHACPHRAWSDSARGLCWVVYSSVGGC
jgi:hypothetical protein